MLAQVRWDGEAPGVPGFVLSSFSPLVAAAADACLRQYQPEPRTAVVLVSASGDAASSAHVAATVAAGGRPGPLFFFQSVPNSVAGYVSSRWGLTGPVVCLCPTGDPRADALAEAALLIGDGDADAALLVLVEQAGDRDSATAILVGKESGDAT